MDTSKYRLSKEAEAALKQAFRQHVTELLNTFIIYLYVEYDIDIDYSIIDEFIKRAEQT